MQSDHAFIDMALAQARLAAPGCSPNPAVGCVLVSQAGDVIGLGHTQPVGQAHAEVMALRDAQRRGLSTVGATAFVTLEPCSHHGRTGPCCDALVAAGIARLVASIGDPNPRVSGEGFARMRAAGVQVDVGLGAEEARELNLGFISRMVRGRPWVRMKVASSLDGRTALPNGASQWITSAEARADGHRWRARADVVLTGIGTVLADDPLLDVRLVPALRQPRLAVIDSRLQTPVQARLWQVAQRQVLIYTAENDVRRHDPLLASGAQVMALANASGKVDLAAALQDLARREVNEVHVEAGYKLNGSLARAGLVDEWLLYQAPLLLGEGQGLAALGPYESLTQGVALSWHSVEHVGADLRILARTAGQDTF